MKLRTLPVTIDADAIACGLIDMATDDERVALRFGLLSARLMAAVKDALESKFRSMASDPEHAKGDKLMAILKDPDRPRVVEFSMRELVSEALHEITLAMYRQTDMVV